MINVRIESDPFLDGLNQSKSIEALTFTLNSEGVKSGDILIIFGDKKLLQDLKKRFFNIDRPTDVIAFRLNEYNEKDIEGEIYICLPIAKENAKHFSETYENEIARLIIHGGLHLIGYKDDTEIERKDMKKLEDKYLREMKD